MSKQEKMENLSKKMKELNEKIKDSAETVAIVGLEAKDKLDEKIEDTKSNVEALKLLLIDLKVKYHQNY